MLLTAILAGTFGLLAAGSLAARPPAMRPDRALVLAALAAFVAPLWILGLVSTPPLATTRRLLGEHATATLRACVRSALGVTLAMAAAPAGVLAGTTLHPEAAGDLLRGAALLGCGAVGAGLFALYAIGAALDHISRGTVEAWRAMSGGGAFGPPETTPLLYAPALGFVLALTPAALLSAVWGAKAELLPPTRALGAAGALWLVGAALAARRLAQLGSGVQRAWLIVEQAHATPFARAEDIPEAPAWLGGPRTDRGQRGAALVLLARSWVRRFPSSAAATVALATIAVLSLSDRDPSWLVAAVSAAIALYSGTRALDLDRVDPDVEGAARWLGADPGSLQRARVGLGLRLLLPCVALTALAWGTGAWSPALGGALLGAAMAWASLRAGRGRGTLVWLGRAGLALSLLACAATGSSPAAGPPGRSTHVRAEALESGGPTGAPTAVTAPEAAP